MHNRCEKAHMSGTAGFVTAQTTADCVDLRSTDPSVEVDGLAYFTDYCDGYWRTGVTSLSAGDYEISLLDRDGILIDAIPWAVRDAVGVAAWTIDGPIDSLRVSVGDQTAVTLYGEDPDPWSGPLDVGIRPVFEIADSSVAEIRSRFGETISPRAEETPILIAGITVGTTTLRYEVGPFSGEVSVVVE